MCAPSKATPPMVPLIFRVYAIFTSSWVPPLLIFNDNTASTPIIYHGNIRLTRKVYIRSLWPKEENGQNKQKYFLDKHKKAQKIGWRRGMRLSPKRIVVVLLILIASIADSIGHNFNAKLRRNNSKDYYLQGICLSESVQTPHP